MNKRIAEIIEGVVKAGGKKISREQAFGKAWGLLTEEQKREYQSETQGRAS